MQGKCILYQSCDKPVGDEELELICTLNDPGNVQILASSKGSIGEYMGNLLNSFFLPEQHILPHMDVGGV